MVYYFDGMNIEIKKHLFILTERIEEDTTISFENLGEVSLYLLDIWLVKMSGMGMESVS